jgi:hypothetical protein
MKNNYSHTFGRFDGMAALLGETYNQKGTNLVFSQKWTKINLKIICYH